jgi:hypothetical protein
MAQETMKFANNDQMDKMLQELFRRAHLAKSNYPIIFVADEIVKMSGEQTERTELRKTVLRLQGLFEHLKQRTQKEEAKDVDGENSYRDYEVKHKIRHNRIELIAISYLSNAESSHPLTTISDYIFKQPDAKILIRRETEDLEKRQEVLKKLVQHFINENPMNLKDIEEFSTNYVKRENLPS